MKTNGRNDLVILLIFLASAAHDALQAALLVAKHNLSTINGFKIFYFSILVKFPM